MRVFFSATLLITGVTIGAGMLGLPHVFAPIHRLLAGGIIVFFGLIMLIVNLMVGEVSFALKKSLQLPGLAGAVVGTWLQKILLVIVIVSWLGALVAYMVGEGDVMVGLFGGSARLWSYVFWAIASVVVVSGFSVVKKTVQLTSMGVIGLLLGISGYALFYQQTTVIVNEQQVVSFWQLVPAFGVALFALHGAPGAVAHPHLYLPIY
jgi:amino acid permease